MTALDLARWQFGLTTAFHFLFVPLSVGLAFIVAIFQTAALRTGKEAYRRLTWYFGKLFLINFALGVVTGIVLEFQFGMNWSDYSRYVGDIFGAPLAIEGLLAFFLESTFLGLWIFGRNRLSPRLHLATIWLVAVGTMLSAVFILGANSWMQHPVGYRINPATARAEMTSFLAVLTNSTLIVTLIHTISAAFATAGMFVVGVSAYHLLRRREVDLFRRAAGIALVVTFVATVGVAFSGHAQAQLMTRQQPMKMAASEALFETQSGASWSLLTIGDLAGNPVFEIRVPHLLSVLATNDWNGTVEGINQIQSREEATHGPGDYSPILWITYWSFHVMVLVGFAMVALAATGLVLLRRRRLDVSRRFLWVMLPAIALPYVANTVGWIFTEMGRQPWVVYGLLKTSDAVSPTVGVGYVLTSLIGFTLVYGALAAVDAWLMVKFSRAEPARDPDVPGPPAESALIY